MLHGSESHDDLVIWSFSVLAPALGWVGAACSLAAYWAVSTGRVAPDSLRYHALNITACALLGLACLATRAWPSMVTNLVFIAFGVRMTWRVRARLVARLRAWVGQRRPRPVRMHVHGRAGTSVGLGRA